MIGFVVLAVQGLLIRTLWGLWRLLELSRVIFLMFLRADYIVKRQGEVLKFFLIQAFSGMLILLGFLTLRKNGLSSLEVCLSRALFLKIGVVPFHSWFLGLSHTIGWEPLLLFLTVQKVIPLQILRAASSRLVEILGALGWAVAAFGGVTAKSLKKVFIYSSLFFRGLLVIASTKTSRWASYLGVYRLINLPLFAEAECLAILKGAQDWGRLPSGAKISIWLGFINLAGIPPMPGFLIKVAFICQTTLGFLRYLLFFLRSVLLVYMYMSFRLKALIETDRIRGQAYTRGGRPLRYLTLGFIRSLSLI